MNDLCSQISARESFPLENGLISKQRTKCYAALYLHHFFFFLFLFLFCSLFYALKSVGSVGYVRHSLRRYRPDVTVMIDTGRKTPSYLFACDDIRWETWGIIMKHRAQELCESRGGRPGLPVPNKLTVSVNVKQQFNFMSLCSELRSCVKVEVDVLGSPSLISLRFL